MQSYQAGFTFTAETEYSLWLIQNQILRGWSMSKMCETVFFNIQCDMEM